MDFKNKTYFHVTLYTSCDVGTPSESIHNELLNPTKYSQTTNLTKYSQPYNQSHSIPPSHINTQIYLYSCARTLAGGRGSAGCRWRPQRRWSGCWCQSAPGSCRCPAGPTWLWAAHRTCASPGQTRSWCWSRQCPGCHPQLQHDQTATSIMIWAFTS